MKYLFTLLLLWSIAFAQPGYTPISTTRYNWTMPGRFSSGLHLPAGCGFPFLKTGQWIGDGAKYIDTCGHKEYFYSGGTWRALADSATGSPAGWNITGNTGTDPSTNFIGTIDNNALIVRTNNIHAGKITPLNSYASLDSLGDASVYLGPYAGYTDRNIIDSGGNIGIGSYALFNKRGTGNQSIAIGHQALYSLIGGGTNVAIGYRSQARSTTGFRNSSLGVNSLHNTIDGEKNVAIGFAAGEWNSTGDFGTFTGESAGRLNTIGHYNTMVGNSAGYSTTGAVKSISVTGGGSGYTTATVTVSVPDITPFGFTPSIQATATATIDAGVIISITMTEIGAGYSSATVLITGDGTGATATATVVGGSQNTAIGATALYSNRIGVHNVGLGYQTGYGDGTNADDRRQIDSFNTYLGYAASARGATPQSIAINKSTAIGYKAIVTQSSSIVIGATGADQPNVGIGNTAPSYPLDITGRMRVTDTARFVHIIAKATTDVIPSLNSIIDGSPIKIGMRGASDGGISLYRADAGNFGGPSIVTYRTNSNDLSTRASMISTQSFVQFIGYGVAGDNNSISTGYMMRVRANGTPKSTYIPSFFEIQLRDTLGIFGTSFRVYPEGTKVGNDFTTAADPSAQLEVVSTLRGFLMPRLTTIQQNAVVTPAAGVMIINSDSTGRPFVYYNGGWRGMGLTGESGGGSGVSQSVITDTLQNYWRRTGNSTGANGSFIGTNDNFDFSIKTNGKNRLKFGASGLVTFGDDTYPDVITQVEIRSLTALLGVGNSGLKLSDIQNGTNVVLQSTSTGLLVSNAAGAYKSILCDGIINPSDGTKLNVISGAWYTDGGNFGVGISPTEKLHVAGNIRFSGALMPNNTAGTSGQVLTSAGAGVVPTWTTPLTVASDTYTPTISNTSNVDATVAHDLQYMRVGSVVTVSGKVEIDATAVTNTVIEFDLPVASNFTTDGQAAGSGGTDYGVRVTISSNLTSNLAVIRLLPSGTANTTYHFSFTYQIL